MKKLLSLLTLSVLPFALGCSDEVSTTGADETDAKARVTLVVQGVDNSLLDSVKVVELASKAKKTTKDGRAMFDDLSVGLHRFTLSRDGYATLIVDVDVNVDATTASMDETAIVRDQDHITVRMSRAAASARGRVLRDGASVGNGATLVPVKGATVHLYAAPSMSGRPGFDQFGHPFYHYETTTDSDGVYLFEGLPEAATYSAKAEHRIDLEHVWRASAVKNARVLLDDGVEVFEDMVLALDLTAYDDSLVLVSDNISGRYLAPSDSVVLVFNRQLNKDDQWADADAVVTMDADFMRVATNVSVDGNKVVVKPALGTSWRNNSCYAVLPTDLADQAGLKTDMASYPHVPVFCVLKESAVAGFEFDSAFTATLEDAYNDNDCLKKNAAFARFNWTPSANPGDPEIGVYEVYVSKNEGKDFVLDQTIKMAAGDTLVTANVELDPATLDVEKVAFQIRSCTKFSGTFFGAVGLWVSTTVDPCGAFLKKAVELDVCDD